MQWKLLWQLFWLFTKVATFSWGGGIASLRLMQYEVVAAGWLTPNDFADDIAFSKGRDRVDYLPLKRQNEYFHQKGCKIETCPTR